MVADRVEVYSRSGLTSEQHYWTSDGSGEFEVAPATDCAVGKCVNVLSASTYFETRWYLHRHEDRAASQAGCIYVRRRSRRRTGDSEVQQLCWLPNLCQRLETQHGVRYSSSLSFAVLLQSSAD